MKKISLESIVILPLIECLLYFSNRVVLSQFFIKVPAFYSLIIIIGLFYVTNLFLVNKYEKFLNIKTVYYRKILIFLCFLMLIMQPIEFPIIMSHL